MLSAIVGLVRSRSLGPQSATLRILFGAAPAPQNFMDVQTEIMHCFVHGCLVSFLNDESGTSYASLIVRTALHTDTAEVITWESNSGSFTLLRHMVQAALRATRTQTTKHRFMARYFIAANIWLIFAVVGVLGRNHKTLGISAFLNGPELDASIYSFMIFVLFAISAFFFVLTWTTRKKS